MPHSASRLVVAFLIAVVAFAGVAHSATFTLQIDEAWNTDATATNTGSVGAVPVTADADLWRLAGFVDDNGSYADVTRYGSLAAEPGSAGDGFVLTLAQGQSDTLTITLGGTLVDPVFLIGDIDLPGATATVTPGFTSFTNNADGIWAGDVLTTLSGAVSDPETVGAHAAVQYAGQFAAGSEFSFAFDYGDSAPGGGDNVLVGIYVVEENGMPVEPTPGTPIVPEPSTALLLGLGFLSLALRRESR